MPFPARLLTEGEEIVHETKQHWIALRDEVAYTFVWLVLWIVIVPWLDFELDEWIAWLITLGWVGVVGFGVARWLSTDLIITTSRLIYRTGLAEKSGYEVETTRLADVGFRQSMWQRLVGAGDLLVDGGGQPRIVIGDLPDPMRLTAVLEESGAGNVSPRIKSRLPGEPAEEAGSPPPKPPERRVLHETAPERRLTRAEQLEILARLHTDGKLTDEEFTMEKRRVLESD